MIDDILTRLDEFSKELYSYPLLFEKESLNEFSAEGPPLIVSTNAQRLFEWEGRQIIPSLDIITHHKGVLHEKIIQKRDEIIEYFESILKTHDNLAIDLLLRGYPSVDTEGVFPTFEIIANIYAKDGTYNLQSDILKLDEYLSYPRLIALDLLLSITQQVFQDEEELMHIDYGITCMSEVIDKYKMPGLFLTNKRLIFVGNDLPDDKNPSPYSQASIMIYPGVMSSIPMANKPKYAKFYYPDSDNYTYFGSVDYIWLDQIDKVKEKKGVFTLNLKKDFRVLSLPEPLPKNRPVGINVEEPELIKPLRKREIEIQLANDKEISEGIKKDRISMFKSTLERALKQL